MSNDHEWLNLIEVSGPFLAVPVLRDAFPQDLEYLPSGRSQRLRRTYEEWRDAVDMDDLDLSELHAAWIVEVLRTALEMDETVLRKGATLPENLSVSMPEHGVTISPDLAVVNPTNSDEPLLLIHAYDPDTDLDTTRRFDGLAITPADRMVALLRATGCPTGIVTNGERWMLVHAPVGAVAGFASWYARLWGQESETLRAFVSLLGVRRFFGPDEGKLPALYERSLKHQDDVTEALGEQVRRAVEVLVQALDRADQDRNRELLRDVDPRELYEAGLTVMMRLVFLLAAEERGLLLLGDPRYDSFYAISSLRIQLRADSEEILERRRSAWSRLLALFRGVYGGIDHPTLRLPALGGSLFDPDRYPFLEGRKKGTSWRSDPAEPLPIDDRTVLLLLDAIQIFEGRTLSYRALDVEQIGHVYEGLLERTVKRVDDVTLELDSGAKAKSPRVTLGEMESARLDGPAKVAELLKERSERSESAIRNALERAGDDRLSARLLTVCRGDVGLRDRILPYAHLLRTDPWGYPLVHHKGAFVVVLGADRRESGTHYTPKSLTEKIVAETLTPVAYRGPAEGKVPGEWELKSAEELLDLKVCDPAMGSGAFLVQACRWLSDRLVEAWSATERSGKQIDSEGRIVEGDTAGGFDPLSQDAEERAIVARRLVAERCLYGVDKNPLAVELAKLSLWLTTMSKGRPFGFLDHNLRSGDSLLGIHDIGQLTELSMSPKGSKQLRLFGRSIQAAVEKAIELRSRLRSIPIRDIRDVDAMAALDGESRYALHMPQAVADAFVGSILAETRTTERADRLHALETLADAAANGAGAAMDRLRHEALADLRVDAPDGLSRKPFHWPLEFPEVFARQNGGFDAIVGNPPFLGGRQMPGKFGVFYPAYLRIAFDTAGPADLVCFFFRRVGTQAIRRGGCFGLIGTNSISETVNSEAALRPIIESGSTLFRAYKSVPWPGVAAVSIAMIYGVRGAWAGGKILDGEIVSEISSNLDAAGHGGDVQVVGPKFPTSQGVNLFGQAFVISGRDAERLKASNPGIEIYLRPFVNGDVLNETASTFADQYVIDFGEREKDQIIGCDEIIEDLSAKILHERRNQTRQIHEHRPWLHWDKRARFLNVARQKDDFFALTIVSAFFVVHKVPTSSLYAHGVQLFDSDSLSDFAVIQSSAHEYWARFNSGSLGQTLRYTASKCWATLPWPENISDETSTIAGELLRFRSELMGRRQCGSNSIYAEFHNPEHHSSEITRLRAIHQSLDCHVLADYGWSDIDAEYQVITQGRTVRLSISENSRRELIRRMLVLNGERAAVGTKNKSKKIKSVHAASIDQSAFNYENPNVLNGNALTGIQKAIVDHLRKRPAWHSKSDIVAATSITDGQWNAAINDLLSRGIVERQGERRGARYRISESD